MELWSPFVICFVNFGKLIDTCIDETEIVEQRLNTFVGHLQTEFAILDRLILLDIICVFNNVSSLSQREQAIKLSQDGFEISVGLKDSSVYLSNYGIDFTDFKAIGILSAKAAGGLPRMCLGIDKYVLVERQNEKDVEAGKRGGEDVSVEASKIQYESIEIFLGGNHEPRGPIQEESNDEFRTQVDSAIAGPSGNDVDALEAGALPSSSPDKNPEKAKRESRNNVAFVSVKRPKVSTNNELDFSIHGTEKGENPDVDKEDPFFSLLISGNMKSSLF
ncbi:hypothetical protein RND71_037651 [Anisodus tanguticus]|uniref:Uncharacterized protein n=1 Tax=Anisodus tanguticus TaxID=243964 RepID=A0AAE1QY74_9SOLA|nr:hypothetical protein RND71_037651 [Anisodus tanguticus]